MADRLTPEQRSRNMAKVKGKDTSIEIRVRKWLFASGFRFRKNDRRLPGCPDIVLPKYRIVVFVHGCFWHRHEGCRFATLPKTRTEFWSEKFHKNIQNDKRAIEQLLTNGWRVNVLWECDLKKHFEESMHRLAAEIVTVQGAATHDCLGGQTGAKGGLKHPDNASQ